MTTPRIVSISAASVCTSGAWAAMPALSPVVSSPSPDPVVLSSETRPAPAQISDGRGLSALVLDSSYGRESGNIAGTTKPERLTFEPRALALFDPPSPDASGSQLPQDGAGSAGSVPQSEDAGSTQNDANNPLTPKITINFHDYYIPSYYGLDDRQSNQFLFRGLIPHDIGGAPQLFRFTLPVAEVPTFPDGTDTGLGDLTLIDWFMFKSPELGMEFGVGPTLVLPTASQETTGAGKWQAGLSGVGISPHKWGLYGGLLSYQQSFASQGGDTHRDEVTLLTFQPLLIYNLPAGFYLRSTAIWNFDLNNGTFYLPIGLGAGVARQIGGVTVNATVEPQFTVAHHGTAPQWQLFMGINFQFKF